MGSWFQPWFSMEHTLLSYYVFVYRLAVRLGIALCLLGVAPATITIGVCGMIIDIAMFIIPFFIIPGLHAKRRQKKGLVVVFLIGFL